MTRDRYGVRLRLAHTATFGEICTPERNGPHAKGFMVTDVPKHRTAVPTSKERLGFPFRTDAELRNERHRIFEDTVSPRH
jgi:hypothetical protein